MADRDIEDNLIAAIVSQAVSIGQFPNKWRFRADHYDVVDVIDELVIRGAIVESAERYVPTVEGLRASRASDARELFNVVEKLVPELRDWYLKNLQTLVGASHFSDQTKLSEKSIRAALTVIQSSQVFQAFGLDAASGVVVKFQLGEGILRLATKLGQPTSVSTTANGTSPGEAGGLYIERLRLTGVKIIDDLEISFVREDGSPRLWTVLVGDNGLCKTTVLQAIALAATGDRLANKLLEDSGALRHARRDQQEARIEVDFAVDPAEGTNAVSRRSSLEVSLTAQPHRIDFQGNRAARNMHDVRAHNTPGYFVAGFGVGRVLARPGEVAVPATPVIDRLEGLFDSRHKMLGIDFPDALRKREPSGTLQLEYANALREALLAEHDGERLLESLTDVELSGGGGASTAQTLLGTPRFVYSVRAQQPLKLTPVALSHGYQSMIAWIGELLGHAFLELGSGARPESLRGIVLIDEIDLHLHPTWQRRIVPILKKTFPLLQFIVTTHSPLVLTGFEEDEIVRLGLEDGAVVVLPSGGPTGLASASQTLGGHFGVPKAGRPELVEKEQQYFELTANSKRTPEQDEKLEQLRDELERYWVRPPREPRS